MERWPESVGFSSQRLQRIDRASLSTQDQLSYDLFAFEYQSRLSAYPFKPFLYDVRPRDGLQSLSEVAELIPFTAVADYDHWIKRLRTIDRYLAQNQSLLEIGIREKRTQPRVVMERVLPQLTALIQSSAENSPFYQPFKRMPDSFPALERARLQAEGLATFERNKGYRVAPRQTLAELRRLFEARLVIEMGALHSRLYRGQCSPSNFQPVTTSFCSVNETTHGIGPPKPTRKDR